MQDFTECRCGHPLLVPETMCRACKVLYRVGDSSEHRKALHLKARFKVQDIKQEQHDRMVDFLKREDAPPTDAAVEVLMAMNTQAVRARRRDYKARTLIDRLQDD